MYFLDSHLPNETPEIKLNKLLTHLQRKVRFDGESITYSWADIDLIRNKLYFEQSEELLFYFGTLTCCSACSI
jgi:hypothetical protein